MITFYSPADLRRLQRKRNIAFAVCAAAALTGLAVCLWLLFTAGTLTAQRNEFTVFAVNAAVGAFVFCVYLNAAVPARRAVSHFAAVQAGEKERFPYTSLKVSETRERVPGGVQLYRVTAQNGNETRSFLIYAPYAKALQGAGERGVLETAGGYITAALPQTGGDGA